MQIDTNMSEEELQKVGVVKHYYAALGVAIVDITASIDLREIIRIKGTTTDFEQTVKSMEVEHKKVDKAKLGDTIGLKVEKRVREKDIVYKIIK